MEVLALERTFTDLDQVQLTNLVHRDSRGGSSPSRSPHLEDELDAADVVPSPHMWPGVVTMYSQVLLVDLETNQRHKLTLCSPVDAEPEAGFMSVLSPLGRSVLGLSVGSVARWRTPTGDARAAEVLAVLSQPEARGDYSM